MSSVGFAVDKRRNFLLRIFIFGSHVTAQRLLSQFSDKGRCRIRLESRLGGGVSCLPLLWQVHAARFFLMTTVSVHQAVDKTFLAKPRFDQSLEPTREKPKRGRQSSCLAASCRPLFLP